MEVIVFLVLVAILAAIAARFLLSVVTIRDYQRGLHYRGGKLVGLLSTGTHYAIKPMSEIQVLDVRPALLTVPGQEILTSDGVALKISLTARYVVVRPGRGDHERPELAHGALRGAPRGPARRGRGPDRGRRAREAGRDRAADRRRGRERHRPDRGRAARTSTSAT